MAGVAAITGPDPDSPLYGAEAVPAPAGRASTPPTRCTGNSINGIGQVDGSDDLDDIDEGVADAGPPRRSDGRDGTGSPADVVDTAEVDALVAYLEAAVAANEWARAEEVVDSLEENLLEIEEFRQNRLDELEAATIITGELEDKAARAPAELRRALEEARLKERAAVASTITRLKDDIAKREIDVEQAAAEREAVLNECDRLRGDIARLHARRSELATTVNSTLGSRIDLQLLCRQLAADHRELLEDLATRRTDLRRIEKEVELRRDQAKADAARNAEALQAQADKKQAVYDSSAELRTEVVKARLQLTKEKRDLGKAQTELKHVKADNAALEEMLAKFEPGFSETVLGRVAELKAEMEATTAHLHQARLDCATHVTKCDADTTRILGETKDSVLKKQAEYEAKVRKLKTRKKEATRVEEESKRVYEALKRNMTEAGAEIKAMNTKLIQAEARGSELEEVLDKAAGSHAASVNTIRENLALLSRNCTAIDKVAMKKEAALEKLQWEADMQKSSQDAAVHSATQRVVQTKSETAMLQEATRRAERAEKSEREAEAASVESEQRTIARRAKLKRTEEEFVAQHALNMEAAKERIGPIREKGVVAKTEMDKINAELEVLHSKREKAEGEMDALVAQRLQLQVSSADMRTAKHTALGRADRAKRMLAEAKSESQVALAKVATERRELALGLGIAEVRFNVAQTLNDRLVKKHAKICNDVHQYRAMLLAMDGAAETATIDHAALRKRMRAMFEEIRQGHTNFVSGAEEDHDAAVERYAAATHRTRHYLEAKQKLEEQGKRLDSVLTRAAEIKFERR
mmetsp:Transcript_5616/g.16932  ORF Transcript_5616/g.16932 Transcript_5616/m.16932 type:complete len:812 (+) Transcript_5616:320-2755(+)